MKIIEEVPEIRNFSGLITLISSADQLITNFLHPVIQLSTLGGTRQKLLLQLLCLICRDIFL